MLNTPEPACLVIADISGYTGYLAGVELDHAQDILADLLSVVVGSLRPTFKLAKLEGDAAFMFVPGDVVDGSGLQDLVEGCYFGYRRRLRDIAQASRCECNACTRIPSLDLKIVVHHGSVVRHRIAGSAELVGADVILVHRLLKNSVETSLGPRAYALYTAACTDAMGLADPAAAGLDRHEESIEHIGVVTTWVRDLTAAWAVELARKRERISDAGTFWKREIVLDGPPPLVWEYITSPIRRPQISADITAVIESSPGGRRGAGTVNHCMHGSDAIVEEIVDWQPFEYWTTGNVFPVPGAPRVVISDELVALPDGRTSVTTRIARGRTAKARAFLEQSLPMIEHAVRAAQDDIARALSALVSGDQDADLVSPPKLAPKPVVPEPLRGSGAPTMTGDAGLGIGR